MTDQGSTAVHNENTINTIEAIGNIQSPQSSNAIKPSSTSNSSSPVAVNNPPDTTVNTAMGTVVEAAVPGALSLTDNMASSNLNNDTITEITNISDTNMPGAASSTATGKKRKRKKKKNGILSPKAAASLDGLENDELFGIEQKIGAGNDLESWKQRAVARLNRVRELHGNIDKLNRDLTEESKRAADAEKQEREVGKSLRSAAMLLQSEKKKQQSLEMENNGLKAQVTELETKEQKLNQRITLLKTVADKAQTAKEETAKKLADHEAHAEKTRMDHEKSQRDLERKHVIQKETLEHELRKEAVEKIASLMRDAAAEKDLAVRRAHSHTASITAAATAVAGILVGSIVRRIARRSEQE